MKYKEVKKDDFVIEYGSDGDEFYLILEGEVEVMVPDKDTDDFKVIDKELKLVQKKLAIAQENYENDYK